METTVPSFGTIRVVANRNLKRKREEDDIEDGKREIKIKDINRSDFSSVFWNEFIEKVKTDGQKQQ